MWITRECEAKLVCQGSVVDVVDGAMLTSAQREVGCRVGMSERVKVDVVGE